MTFALVITPLVLYFPILLWTHRIIQRRLCRRIGEPTPAQGTGLRVVSFVSSVFVLFIIGICAMGWIPTPWALWATVVLFGGGYFYWLFLCITESARRYKIATLIEACPSITEDGIVTHYNAALIVTRRIERLSAWGALHFDGQRYRSRPSMILLASRLVRAWAIILGFEWPQQLQQPDNRPKPQK